MVRCLCRSGIWLWRRFIGFYNFYKEIPRVSKEWKNRGKRLEFRYKWHFKARKNRHENIVQQMLTLPSPCVPYQKNVTRKPCNAVGQSEMVRNSLTVENYLGRWISCSKKGPDNFWSPKLFLNEKGSTIFIIRWKNIPKKISSDLC